MTKTKSERQQKEYDIQLSNYNNLIKTVSNKCILDNIEKKTNKNHRFNYEIYLNKKILKLEKTLKFNY